MFLANTVIGHPGDFSKDRPDAAREYKWPEDGVQSVPDWVYTSPEINRRKIGRFSHGPPGNYAALEAEIPNPGDHPPSFAAPPPVGGAPDQAGSAHVFETRGAPRGA